MQMASRAWGKVTVRRMCFWEVVRVAICAAGKLQSQRQSLSPWPMERRM